MTSPQCPMCLGALEERIERGVTWACPGGHGTAMTMELLEARVPDAVVGRLLVQARASVPGTRRCPFCAQIKAPVVKMVEISAEEGFVKVDMCPLCRGVWLDPEEYDRLVAVLKRDADPA